MTLSHRYHNSKMINFNDDEDGLSVLTIPPQNITIKVEESHKHQTNLVDHNKSIYRVIDDTFLDVDNPSQTREHDVTERKPKIFTALSSSILLVNQVRVKHSGNYTCQPSNTQATWVDVQVMKSN